MAKLLSIQCFLSLIVCLSCRNVYGQLNFLKENPELISVTLSDYISVLKHELQKESNSVIWGKDEANDLLIPYVDKIRVIIKAIDESLLNETLGVIQTEAIPKEPWLHCIMNDLRKLYNHIKANFRIRQVDNELDHSYGPWPFASHKRSMLTPRAGRVPDLD